MNAMNELVSFPLPPLLLILLASLEFALMPKSKLRQQVHLFQAQNKLALFAALSE